MLPSVHNSGGLPMSETIAVLRAEHKVMARLLDLLGEQVDHFEAAEQTDYELMKEIIDYFLTIPDLYHHPKEDLIHARMLRRGAAKAEGMHDIPSEHERVSERLHAFSHALISVLLDAEFPREQFVGIAREFVDGERRHMRGEEAEFFPAAEEILNDQDWADIDGRVSGLKDPLVNGDRSMRFQAIRERIAD